MCESQPIYPLTQRERMVARHLFICHSSVDIAERTQMARRMVEHDLHQLRRKMGERSSFMAAVKAFHFGLLEVGLNK